MVMMSKWQQLLKRNTDLTSTADCSLEWSGIKCQQHAMLKQSHCVRLLTKKQQVDHLQHIYDINTWQKLEFYEPSSGPSGHWRRAWRVRSLPSDQLLLWVFYPAYLKSSVCLQTSRGGSWKDRKPPSRQRLLKMCWQLLNKVLNIKIAISVFAANYLENF